MRSPKKGKTKKQRKARLTKKKNKSRRVWCYRNSIIPVGVNLEDLEEVIENSSKQIVSKGSWKVVPKDSCEVYKKRRTRRQEMDDDTASGRDDECRPDIQRRKRKKQRRISPKKKRRTPWKRAKSYGKSEKRPRKLSVSTCSTISTTGTNSSGDDSEVTDIQT